MRTDEDNEVRRKKREAQKEKGSRGQGFKGSSINGLLPK